jgi:hypothetical protein
VRAVPALKANFGVAQDATDLAFSPDGTCFAVWDSPLEYGVRA